MKLRRVVLHTLSGATLGAALALSAPSAYAQKKYDPGATDTEIKIGHITAYSAARRRRTG
jgi:branched-chain amino acid transport system substrate-binding protein